MGRRFGRLEIVSLSDKKDKRDNSYWLCKCDCGKEKVISELSLLYKRTTSCGCYRREMLAKVISKPDKNVATNLLFLHYKNQAKRRKINFELSQDQFKDLIFQNCFYCGCPPANYFNNYRKKNHAKHLITMYNGIDRMDCTKGYIEGNCVPCCGKCNYSKRTMGYEEFKEWVVQVYTHMNLGEKTNDSIC
jgi:hypothetical protein